MTTTRFLTVDELAYINDRLTGAHLQRPELDGLHKVRDPELLERAAMRPAASAFGADAYPTLAAKAAALMHAIARYHPFADGNKRTATVAAIMLLRINGQCVVWDAERALGQIVALAEGDIDDKAIATWLHTEPCDPLLTPEASADMALIEQIIDEHRWLLTELAKQ